MKKIVVSLLVAVAALLPTIAVEAAYVLVPNFSNVLMRLSNVK